MSGIGNYRATSARERIVMTNISTVRMQLFDYDAAPDGCGTYVRLNRGFASVEEALQYRDRYMASMYWGAIYDIYGNRLVDLEERRLL